MSFRVRKYRPRSTQYFNCFEYGNVATRCQRGKRCNRCSSELLVDHSCSTFYCCHCEGEHSPQSRLCPRFKFEQDVIESFSQERGQAPLLAKIVFLYNMIGNCLNFNVPSRNRATAIAKRARLAFQTIMFWPLTPLAFALFLDDRDVRQSSVETWVNSTALRILQRFFLLKYWCFFFFLKFFLLI